MTLLDDYESLSTNSSSAQIQAALNGIIKANAALLSSDERIGLVKLILGDLANKDKGRLKNTKDRPLACEALKLLGRFPDSARLISSKQNLELLIKNADISPDVVRTMANTLLLQADGRQNFTAAGGGDYALKLISSTSDPQTLFLGARLLFLLTVDSSSVPVIREMIEKGNIMDITIAKIDVLVKQLGQDPMARGAFSDILKYIYNMMLHFSRAEVGNTNLVMGEAWSDKFGPWVLPLVTAFHLVPFSSSSVPLQPPMTHLIHCLLSIPTENYKTAWYNTPQASTKDSAGASLIKAARSLFTPRSSSPSPPLLKRQDSTSKKSTSRDHSPAPSRSSSSSHNPPRRSSSDNNGNGNGKDKERESFDTVQRCINLVSSCLEHYFPGDVEVDASEVREKATAEDVVLDDLLCPPLLLLRKLAEGDLDARRRVKNWILPDDLDRSEPLEGRSDSLGRLIRLLGSVYHSRLANTAGELIFTVCDSDSGLMSALIGYGNAAGYLFNKGILSAPPAPKGKDRAAIVDEDEDAEDDPAGAHINPITGTVWKKGDKSALDEMTEEEKEREAEKLFVLFDRLERTGVAANPIRQALHEGKLEKYKNEEGKEDSDED